MSGGSDEILRVPASSAWKQLSAFPLRRHRNLHDAMSLHFAKVCLTSIYVSPEHLVPGLLPLTPVDPVMFVLELLNKTGDALARFSVQADGRTPVQHALPLGRSTWLTNMFQMLLHALQVTWSNDASLPAAIAEQASSPAEDLSASTHRSISHSLAALSVRMRVPQVGEMVRCTGVRMAWCDFCVVDLLIFFRVDVCTNRCPRLAS